MQTDIDVSNASGGSATISIWNNTGTFKKSSGLGEFTIGAIFNNRGTVLLESGEIELWSGGDSSGAFNLAQGTVWRWAGGTHALGTAAKLQGMGSIQFAGGTVTVFGTLNISGDVKATGGIGVFGPGAQVLPVFERSCARVGWAARVQLRQSSCHRFA